MNITQNWIKVSNNEVFKNSIIKNAADKAEMIVELKPKKRPSVGSKKCQPYFNQVY
jgi:hypothetical protein